MSLQTETGKRLVSRGFNSCKADWIIHVCFDTQYFTKYDRSGPCMFFYRPWVAAELAEKSTGVYGSRAGSSEKRTGYGAKIEPKALNAVMKSFNPDPSFLSLSLGDRGVSEVRKLYESAGWTVRDASKNEQITEKIDLIVTRNTETRKLEVKARGEDKAFRTLFIQTHEANPDKRIT